MSAHDEPIEPIIMPMVRRAIPNLIAQELVGVQPMGDPSGTIFDIEKRTIVNFYGDEIGGMSKDEVIAVLKKHCPENFV